MRSILSVSAAALLATCLSAGAYAAPAAKSDGKMIVAQNYGTSSMDKADSSKKKVSKKSMKKSTTGSGSSIKPVQPGTGSGPSGAVLNPGKDNAESGGGND
jgi:hypothetical protein